MITIAYVIASVIVAYLGRNTRFGFWGNFFASLLMTPLVGLLLVLAVDPAQGTTSKRQNGPKGA